MEELLRFAGIEEWDRWLGEHAGTASGAWLLLAKKGADGLSAADAGDVAICHGWIDSQRKGLDGDPLPAAVLAPPGRQPVVAGQRRAGGGAGGGRPDAQPGGRAQVEAAQADGRWAAAYERQRTAEPPAELLAALAADDRARAAYEALGRSERYGLFLPLLKARTPATRATALRRILAALRGPSLRDADLPLGPAVERPQGLLVGRAVVRGDSPRCEFDQRRAGQSPALERRRPRSPGPGTARRPPASPARPAAVRLQLRRVVHRRERVDPVRRGHARHHPATAGRGSSGMTLDSAGLRLTDGARRSRCVTVAGGRRARPGLLTRSSELIPEILAAPLHTGERRKSIRPG